MLSGDSHAGGRAFAALAAWALVVAALTGCGGGSSDSDTTVAETVNQETAIIARTSGPTEAVLHPLGGGKATGRARYMKKADGTPFIEIRARGLEPVSGDRQYIVWQKRSRDDMVMLATWYVGKDRRLDESWEPSSASLGYLEDGLRTKLLITKIEVNDRLYEPGASKNSYVHYIIGHPVLEGDFTGSLVGATAESE